VRVQVINIVIVPVFVELDGPLVSGNAVLRGKSFRRVRGIRLADHVLSDLLQRCPAVGDLAIFICSICITPMHHPKPLVRNTVLALLEVLISYYHPFHVHQLGPSAHEVSSRVLEVLVLILLISKGIIGSSHLRALILLE
jgi:hypothetical protein